MWNLCCCCLLLRSSSSSQLLYSHVSLDSMNRLKSLFLSRRPTAYFHFSRFISINRVLKNPRIIFESENKGESTVFVGFSVGIVHSYCAQSVYCSPEAQNPRNVNIFIVFRLCFVFSVHKQSNFDRWSFILIQANLLGKMRFWLAIRMFLSKTPIPLASTYHSISPLSPFLPAAIFLSGKERWHNKEKDSCSTCTSFQSRNENIDMSRKKSLDVSRTKCTE